MRPESFSSHAFFDRCHRCAGCRGQTTDHPWREGDDARVEDRHDRSPGDIDLSARARRIVEMTIG
jgi:hypothetical protein